MIVTVQQVSGKPLSINPRYIVCITEGRQADRAIITLDMPGKDSHQTQIEVFGTLEILTKEFNQ
jgi:hypothetical protein